jgi:leucyl aminopeptidase (aminopeptidase T)
MNDTLQAAVNLIEVNFALSAGESLVMISDGAKPDLAASLRTLCVQRGISFSEHVLAEEPAYELPEAAVSLLYGATAALVSTRRSYTHTDGVRGAARAGARIATNSRVSQEQLVGGLLGDYHEIARMGARYAALLEAASEVRITSPSGTDLAFGIRHQAGMSETGLYTEPGVVGNLPAGEAACGIDDGSGNGVLVVDGSYPGLGLITEPISLTFKDGGIVNATGGRADELTALLEVAGSGSGLLAELGIGLNPSFEIQGNTLLDEKIAGTIHIATGNDVTFGGGNAVSYHADAVIRSPRLYLDGVEVQLPGT